MIPAAYYKSALLSGQTGLYFRMPRNKTCSKCGHTKLLTEFFAEARAADGKRTTCKACDHARRVKHRTGLTVAGAAAYRAKRQEQYGRDRLTKQQYSAAYRLQNRARNLVYLAQARANKRGLPFDLNQHVEKLQTRIDAGTCELSGIPFQLDKGRCYASPSFDRIRPERGYVYSNIRVVCQAMNCALGSWGEQSLWEVLQAWARKRAVTAMQSTRTPRGSLSRKQNDH